MMKMRNYAKRDTSEIIKDPKRSILNMMAFVSITFIAIKLNGFMDTVWIANISKEAVTAVSTVSPIYSTVSALGVGLGTGACVCISYCLGRGDVERANGLAGNAIHLTLVVSIPTILFLLFGTEIIFNDLEGSEVKELIGQYIIPLAIGSPVIIMAGVMANFLKAEGAMRIMSVCSLISIPVNAIMTPILVYVCNIGIAGASIATVMGSIASTLMIVYFYTHRDLRLKPHVTKFSKRNVREILGVGLPRTLEEFFGALIFLIQSIVILAKIGGDGLAIHGLAFSIPYLMTLISDSVSAAAQPVSSAAAGAKREDVMRTSMSFSASIIFSLSGLVVIILLIFPEQILMVFNGGNVSTIEGDLVVVTRIYALMIPFYLISRFCSNMLQVVRKAHIWAPTSILLSSSQVACIYFVATNVIEMAWVVMTFTILIGLVAVIMLLICVHRFRSERIDKMIEEEKGVIVH